MKWRTGRRSGNIEDRRGASTGMRLGGGLGGIGIAVAVVVFLLGGDPSQLLAMLVGGEGPVVSDTSTRPGAGARSPQEAEQADFVSVVLADTEDTWRALFQQQGSAYRDPRLVLFSGQVESACGYASAATGPFYCPGDQKVYLDLGFFAQLESLGAPGDFARAYVIGHEVGHHVQNLTGVIPAVGGLQAGTAGSRANALQVLVELQADCYAGVWAYHAGTQRDVLEQGDVEEGIRAASAIGDDALQQRAGRQVRPDAFTHGSSAQRVDWFRRGLRQGDMAACDTFGEAGVKL